jgi:hypothetical protein
MFLTAYPILGFFVNNILIVFQFPSSKTVVCKRSGPHPDSTKGGSGPNEMQLKHC